MIRIVGNIEKANVITHSGKFHADDIFSTVLLEKILGELNVFRTFEITEEDNGKIYYDIGGGKFDHHHISNNEMRNELIPYAAFGLLWREFGKKYISNFDTDIDYVFNYIDKRLVMGIDAVDNGVFYKCELYNILDVSGIISLFNPRYDEEVDSNEKFIEACNFARVIFDNLFDKALSIAKSKNEVEKCIEKSENHILILDEYMPYKEHILVSNNIKAKDIYFVIHKSNRKGYIISTLPNSVDDDTLRMKFPEEWAGLREKNLDIMSGVSNTLFCHKNLFIAATYDYESAINLANKAIQLNNKN